MFILQYNGNVIITFYNGTTPSLFTMHAAFLKLARFPKLLIQVYEVSLLYHLYFLRIC